MVRLPDDDMFGRLAEEMEVAVGGKKGKEGRSPSALPSSPVACRLTSSPYIVSQPPEEMSLIHTPLATLPQISCTPSRADGIPADLEGDLRMYGAMLIQEAGRLCKLYASLVPPLLSRPSGVDVRARRLIVCSA
jgi:hypothetical protein